MRTHLQGEGKKQSKEHREELIKRNRIKGLPWEHRRARSTQEE